MKNYYFMLLAALLFLSSCEHKHSENGLPPSLTFFKKGEVVTNNSDLLRVTACVQNGYKIVKFKPSTFKGKIKTKVKPEDGKKEIYTYETFDTLGITLKAYTITLELNDAKDSEDFDGRTWKYIEADVEHDYLHRDSNSHDDGLNLYFESQGIDMNSTIIQHHVSHKVIDPREGD